MGKVKQKASKDSSSMMRPALTPEARENQLISLAVDLAEKQLRRDCFIPGYNTLFEIRFNKRTNRKRNT